MTTRRADTRRWLAGHVRDPFVRQAQEDGYRSRAAYKLLELDRRDRLLRPGATVVDLGAAPGGWSQVAALRVQPGGRVVAIDRLEIVPISRVSFLHGDFMQPQVRAVLAQELPGGADVVLSDMAPNLTGLRDVDTAGWLELAMQALDFASSVLQPSGALVVKGFQGQAVAEYRAALTAAFARVEFRKPAASRERSRELYFLARGRH